MRIFYKAEPLTLLYPMALQQAPALEIYADGASRGNPGPAAYAYLFLREGAVIFEQSAFLGNDTNNTA
jgi:ribonuclease HI